MNNTYQILLNWDKGQAFSERLSSKILSIEDFEEIDPQSPLTSSFLPKKHLQSSRAPIK
jgi:hypothetical protein